MNSQRGPPPNSLWTKNQQQQQQPTLLHAQNSTGNLSQRGTQQRAEWSKPTSIITSKPLNQHRSIDAKGNNLGGTLMLRKIDLNNSNGIAGNQSTNYTHNFLFNTYSSNGLQNMKNQSQNSEQHSQASGSNNGSSGGGGGRHLSIKGWRGNNYANLTSQNQQNQYLKNLLNSTNSSHQQPPGTAANSHLINKTLESSSSASNLMLDSAIMNTLQHQQNQTATNDNQKANARINEIQTQFDNFNNFRENQQQRAYLHPTQNELTHELQQFAPPQSTKSMGSNNNNSKNFQKLPLTSAQLSEKISFDSGSCGDMVIIGGGGGGNNTKNKGTYSNRVVGSTLMMHQHQMMLRSPESIIDQTIDSDIEDHNQDDDINESVILFQQSTHRDGVKSDEPTPKSNDDQQPLSSLQSYKTSTLSSNDKSPPLHQQHTFMTSKPHSNKESRNQLHQIYLSHQQIPNDQLKPQNHQHLIYQSQQQQQQQTIEDSSSSNSHTMKKAQQQTSSLKNSSDKKIKAKNKQSGLNQKHKQQKLSTSNNPAAPVSLNQVGSKTPSDVFSYKLKTANTANLRLDGLVKGATTTTAMSSIPSNSNRMMLNKKQTSASNSVSTNKSQSHKPPIIQNRKDTTTATITHGLTLTNQNNSLGKCESQKELFYTQQNQSRAFLSSQNLNHLDARPSLNDELVDKVQLNLLPNDSKPFYQTTANFKTATAPPNSDQTLSPETQFTPNSNLISPPPPLPHLSNQPSLKSETQKASLTSNGKGVQILDFDLDNVRDSHKQQIRVVSRFRPLNKIEKETRDAYANQGEVVKFMEDQKTLKINERYIGGNMQFTFDHIFTPEVSQEEVFNIIGKETIDDIMEGYNGTIFAYGQTGSGKTYTMYGQDIFDDDLMGIVPRAARQIFHHIKTQDLEIEYQIRVQMVEIYKEQLRDLLCDSSDHPPPELKIKEDPKRGTYVEGLNDVCIVSEEEIMTVLCTGETMRHVASTRLNQVSSRSHSICIIEIIQKYPNDSERRGVLNLVDLAGSERVSKSQAQGQALEEAKKINFSLSMLGKVINCLTKNAPYIPYRDSKLTRLLKESLGGNNKTSLIVACSMHHSHIEETMSTLRFAQSAKFIENRVKMNIKTSPEQLQLIIQQLKQELFQCKEEIYRLRITSNTATLNSQNETQHNNKKPPASICNGEEQSKVDDDNMIFQPCNCGQNDQEHQHYNQPSQSEEKQLQNNQLLEFKHTLHNRPHQSLLAKNYDVIETNNHRMQMLSLLSSEFSSIHGYYPQNNPNGTGTPNFISPVKNYELKLMQLITRNEDLEMKLKSKDSDLDAFRTQKEELHSKVSTLEEKIIGYKQKLLGMEKKVAEYESDRDFMMVKEVKQEHKLEDYQNQNEVLTSQIKCLEQALEESEKNCQELLKEKQSMYQKSIKELLNETIKMKRIKVSDALENFINKPQTDLKKSFISQLDLLTDYNSHQKLIQDSDNLISPLNEKDLLSRNLYSVEFINALEDTPPELTIYLLKQTLIEASLANHNLQRILAVNRWRQVMEYGKHKIKSNLCKVQENTIETLEEVLDRTRKTHDKLRNRVDKLENHLYDNRNYYGDIVMLTEGNNVMGSGGQQMIKQFNSLKDKTNQMHQQQQQQQQTHNQSVVSMILGSNNFYAQQTQGNQKSRFVRTITNKTLGKVFNFIEKSPMSRASIGANNQSILSHYYGQKHNANYNKQCGTPNRTTGGMNSPVFYNFQSPIRRQNTFAFTNNNGNKPLQPQIVNQKHPRNKENDLLSGASTVPHKFLNNENNIIAYQSNPNQLLNHDQLTFEDAIVKFFNSSEIEDKNAQRTNTQKPYDLLMTTETKNNNMQLSHEDLAKIESLENIQDIKDYIRCKFDTQTGGTIPQQQQLDSTMNPRDQLMNSASVVHHNPNPLFVQYQNNALHQQNSSSNLQSSQVENNPQINSHTTNNNLYGQSNDFYDGQVPSSQKGATYLDNNQRQEHVLTLASDYLITSNSVIGPNALFSGSGQIGPYQNGNGQNHHFSNANNQYYQNDYMDRLQEKIVQLQEEVETQKCRAEEHKRAYYESKRQIEQMRELMEEKESQHNTILKSEVGQWERAIQKFREMQESELLKKQKEIEKLHEILAQWIEQYQELEHNKGVKHQEIDKLITETLQHKRNKSGILSEAMKTPHHKRLSNVMQSLQSFDNRQHYLTHQLKQSYDHKSSSSSNAGTHNIYKTIDSNLQNKQMDKKIINGDNSPVAQEDSCFDIDQSRQNTQENCESKIILPLQTYNSD